ncbi:hypothetical protein [Henriciella pelagia]|uniref:hypothetical protein n=1 Tax=Henriciella pelagia TaxID=1977912 RepID=UPI003512BE7E
MADSMLNDKRTIVCVNTDCGSDNVAVVGSKGVTRIKVYGEPSHYCSVPFLAIYKGDHLHSRLPAHSHQIIYADPEPNNDR